MFYYLYMLDCLHIIIIIYLLFFSFIDFSHSVLIFLGFVCLYDEPHLFVYFRDSFSDLN